MAILMMDDNVDQYIDDDIDDKVDDYIDDDFDDIVDDYIDDDLDDNVDDYIDDDFDDSNCLQCVNASLCTGVDFDYFDDCK